MFQSIRPQAMRLTALVTLLVFSLASYQCGSKDDPSPSGNNSAVVGTWKFTGFAARDAKGVVEDVTSETLAFFPCFSAIRLIFNADGNLTASGGQACAAAGEIVDTSGTSKWSTNGTKLTITDPDGTKNEFDYEVSGSTLKLTAPDDPAKPTAEASILTLTKA